MQLPVEVPAMLEKLNFRARKLVGDTYRWRSRIWMIAVTKDAISF
jgi:hypothetical protein